MTAQALYRLAFRRFRPGRLRRFYDCLSVTADHRVLDVGGSTYFWTLAAELGLPMPEVTVANLRPAESAIPPRVRWIVADARRLPFADAAFDAVFSNSVIEHVGGSDDRQRMADEVRRVGRAYFVQTPDRAFPVEPHTLTPFLHWLPERWRRCAPPSWTVRALFSRLSPDEAADLAAVRLLGRRELAALFPDAAIIRERLLGWPKSLIAWRGDSP
jgi:hypothetical protein